MESLSKGICFRLGSEQYLHPLSTVKEVLSYQESKDLTFDLIYSDIDDNINGEKYKNTRIFVNYSF